MDISLMLGIIILLGLSMVLFVIGLTRYVRSAAYPASHRSSVLLLSVGAGLLVGTAGLAMLVAMDMVNSVFASITLLTGMAVAIVVFVATY